MKGDLKELKVPEVAEELIKTIALLGKSSFNKSIGIEPIFLKGFVPLFSYIMKSQPYRRFKLLTLKTLGIFVNHSSLIPIKMQNFYKDLLD
mmetsp:Transcript_3462/g.2461  ORF Transcript_3462/g.2461 Transcript_3462/m.2461 type:complete len:91 (-) Transcript_3462:2163-2435(-)